MVERQEVEALLKHCSPYQHSSFSVHAPTLAALCRAWLAAEEAPEGVVDILTGWDDGSGAVEVHYESGRPPGLDIKQRVRIVKEAGDD